MILSSQYSQSWYKHATVRTRAPILLKTDSLLPLFPEELLPICQHPLIAESQNYAKEYLITQTCYKFLQEICITETDVVNPTSLSIAYGNVPVQLPEEVKADALSIIVDEAFHSYVAKTFMLQIQQHTKMTPLQLPLENELTKALHKTKALISPEIKSDFMLIATCISENIFTDEIIEVSRLTNVNESFHQVLVEHARDEGRHASYFAKVMQAYWEQADNKKKLALTKVIPKFITYCLDGIHDNDFLIRVLREFGFSETDITALTASNNNEVTRNNKLSRINNIIRCMKTADLWAYTPLADAISNIKDRA